MKKRVRKLLIIGAPLAKTLRGVFRRTNIAAIRPMQTPCLRDTAFYSVAIITIILLPVLFFSGTDILQQSLYADGRKSEPLRYSLEVTIHPGGSSLQGVARILSGIDRTISLHSGILRITSGLAEDGKLTLKAGREQIVEFQLESGKSIPGEIMVGSDEVLLTGAWYPFPIENEAIDYTLSVIAPEQFQWVSESETDERVTVASGKIKTQFHMPHALPSLSLVGSTQWISHRKKIGSITLETLFSKGNDSLSGNYLDRAEESIGELQKILGPLPYKRFRIVESQTPVGWSFATYTLLGSKVIPLPFIPETSLPHEIVHQWFGNRVFVDASEGNWCEGVATYLADHQNAKKQQRDGLYRKELLFAIADDPTGGGTRSLSSFRDPSDPGSRSSGYNRGALYFHQLEQQMGTASFQRGLKNLVSREGGQFIKFSKLNYYMLQESSNLKESALHCMLEAEELPVLSPEIEAINYSGEGWQLTFHIRNAEKGCRETISVSVETPSGVETRRVSLDEGKRSWNLPDRPLLLRVDPQYEMVRTPLASEFPPLIDPSPKKGITGIIYGEQEEDLYKAIASLYDAKSMTPQQAMVQLESGGNLILAGGGVNHVESFLAGIQNRVTDEEWKSAAFVRSISHPFNEQGELILVRAASEELSKALARKIPRYRFYSELILSDTGKTLSSKRSDSTDGATVVVQNSPGTISPGSWASIKRRLISFTSHRVLYIGEHHTNPAHHATQLSLIRWMSRYNKDLCIGMEMLPASVQPVLDRFISGMIGEEQFLRESGWFQNWGYDYNLYRPIFDFARAKKIPVIALNLEREIISKVGSGGVASLNEEERKRIPEKMDWSDTMYRDRLRKVFQAHGHGVKSTEAAFARFYQAQIVWDEVMAANIAEILESHPKRVMAVIAGSGHLEFRSGIPSRVERRTGVSGIVVIQGNNLESRGVDYKIDPENTPFRGAPTLGVALKNDPDLQPVVLQVDEEGVLGKAGVRPGDRIQKLNGREMKGIEEIKIELYKLTGRKGTTLTIERDQKLIELPIQFLP